MMVGVLAAVSVHDSDLTAEHGYRVRTVDATVIGPNWKLEVEGLPAEEVLADLTAAVEVFERDAGCLGIRLPPS